MKWVLVDFKRTLYDPDKDCLEENAREFLESLKKKGFKLVLVAKSRLESRKKLEELGIADLFDKISIEEEKGLEQFRSLMQELGFKPKECISIGDRVKKEIRYSKQLGFRTIWLKKGKFADELPESEEEPDFIVGNLSEALEIIESLLT